MRRKSTDLFTEAKKRFQFKPVSSRKQHLQDIMGRRTPECSNVRDKEKENQDIDISWLNNLMRTCNDEVSQQEEQLFPNKEIEKDKHVQVRKLVGKNKNIIRMLKQNELKDKSLSKRKIHQGKKKLNTQQVILRIKDINESQFNLNERSSIKQRLSLSRQSSIPHNSNITEQPPLKQGTIQYQAIDQTSILEINHNKLDQSSQQNEQKLNISDSLQITILKIQQHQPAPPKYSTDINFQVCKIQQFKRDPQSRSIGRIKKNIKKPLLTQSCKKNPIRQFNTPSSFNRKLSVVSNEKYVSKYIQQQSAIWEQDQSKLPQTSRIVQNKLQQIFDSLDRDSRGELSQENCNNSYLNQNIKILTQPIVTNINRRNQKYSKKQFLSEMSKIASKIDEKQLRRLFTLPVLSFQKQRKAEQEIFNIFQSRKPQQVKQNNVFESIKRCQKSVELRKTPIDIKQFERQLASQREIVTQRIKTEVSSANKDISHINTWKRIQNHYDTNRQIQRNKIDQQIKSTQKYDTGNTSITIDNYKTASWNSTLTNYDFSTKTIVQPVRLQQSTKLTPIKLQQQGDRLQQLNQRLQKYIRQHISEPNHLPDLSFYQLQKNLY